MTGSRFIKNSPNASSTGAAPDSAVSETTVRLLARVRDGDQEALNEVFAREIPHLTRWARGFGFELNRADPRNLRIAVRYGF